MDILSVLIILIIIGALLYLIEQFPIDSQVKLIIRIVILIVVLLWLLRLFVPALGIPLGPRP